MSIEENIFLARVAEQSHRFQEMIDFLMPLMESKAEHITLEERNLLSTAFKNLIASKRNGWHTISVVQESPKYSKYVESLDAYKKKVEEALFKDCEYIIDIINTKLLPKDFQPDTKVFFIKMIADFNRYMAEVANGEKLEKLTSQALISYKEAFGITLHPCCPVRLSLALNFSIFYYDVLKETSFAYEMAHDAMTAAVEKSFEAGEDFEDGKDIITLLKENLQLWRDIESGDAQEL